MATHSLIKAYIQRMKQIADQILIAQQRMGESNKNTQRRIIEQKKKQLDFTYNKVLTYGQGTITEIEFSYSISLEPDITDSMMDTIEFLNTPPEDAIEILRIIMGRRGATNLIIRNTYYRKTKYPVVI